MPNFKHSALIKSLKPDMEYEIEIDGQVMVKTGRELRLFILTQKMINFKLEQQVDLSLIKN